VRFGHHCCPSAGSQACSCGVCGASFIIVTRTTWLVRHIATRTCENKHAMRLIEIDQPVLTALKRHLLNPACRIGCYRSLLCRAPPTSGERVPARGIRGKWCATAQANHEALESRLRLADHANVTVLQPNAAAKLQTEVAQSRKP